jgi:hypothetical protein
MDFLSKLKDGLQQIEHTHGIEIRELKVMEWTNHLGGFFWCRFKLDQLNLLPSLIPGLPTRPSTPLELEAGSVTPSLNFRNLTLWNPQVGFTPWLGSASISGLLLGNPEKKCHSDVAPAE